MRCKITDMSQEELFDQVYDTYKAHFPTMLHSSGGLPDAKGPGTSDVDISLFHAEPESLALYFPADTEVDRSSEGRIVYKLKGYPREVNIYCSNGLWWNRAALHRQTELALNAAYPALMEQAYAYKRDQGISTEAAWAQVLGLGDDYFEVLLDVDRTLAIATQV